MNMSKQIMTSKNELSEYFEFEWPNDKNDHGMDKKFLAWINIFKILISLLSE